MKRLLKLGLCVLSTILVLSCSEKKSNTIIITKKKVEVPKTVAVRRMGDYNRSQQVSWLGNTYTLHTQLKADTLLPLAADGNTRYYDNEITLRIVRADGTEFLKRSFTKDFFKPYVEDVYYKDGAILGIVFVKAEGNVLLFAASVGNPDKSSDEYVPLVLKIDNFGHVSVSKDTSLDTESDLEMQDDEDGV